MANHIFIIVTMFVAMTVLGFTYNKTIDNENKIMFLSGNSNIQNKKIDLVIEKLDNINICLKKLEDKITK